MKSKLLQKTGCERNQSREVVDNQQESIEDSSGPVDVTRARTTRLTLAVDGAPRLRKHNPGPGA